MLLLILTTIRLKNSLRKALLRKGQTLEALLENLAEDEAEVSGNGKSTDAESKVNEERPWRGVFALDYPRQEIFTVEHEVNVNALPPLPAEVRIDARRMADESE